MKKICPICGKEFEASSGVRKYCSPQCAREGGLRKNYTNILERNHTRVEINKDLLYAYNFKCAICGWGIPVYSEVYKRKETQGGCQFHHIIPVCEGGSSTESNIVLLCPNCHKMAHAGLLSREKLMKHTFTKEQAAEARKEAYFEERCRYAELMDELLR